MLESGAGATSEASGGTSLQCPLCDEVHALRYTRSRQKPFFFCYKAGTNVFLRTEWGIERVEEWVIPAKEAHSCTVDEDAPTISSGTENGGNSINGRVPESTLHADNLKEISMMREELRRAKETRLSIEGQLAELKAIAEKKRQRLRSR